MRTILTDDEQKQWINDNSDLSRLLIVKSKAGAVRLLDARMKTLATSNLEGEVLGEFIQDNFQQELKVLVQRGYRNSFLGIGSYKNGHTTIDCELSGIEIMIVILNAIGFEVVHNGNCIDLFPISARKSKQRDYIAAFKKFL